MSLVTTGVPAAIASTTGSPYPSEALAVTSAAHSRSRRRYSASVTPPWKVTRAPGGTRARSCSVRRSGKRERIRSSCSGSRPMASMSRSTRL